MQPRSSANTETKGLYLDRAMAVVYGAHLPDTFVTLRLSQINNGSNNDSNSSALHQHPADR
jgi:hypothetical protein